MKIQEAEKKINDILLNVIIGFSFIADSKDEISDFLRRHVSQATEHLIQQYKKYKDLYISFKTRHQQQSKKK